MEAENEGVKPVAGCAGLGAAFSTVFGVKRLVAEGVDATEGFVPLIAFSNMFEVDVAGWLNFGVGAAGCGVGVAGVSPARARFDDEKSWFWELSSVTLRFVDNADSYPVTPFAVACCFFALSIFFLKSEVCW